VHRPGFQRHPLGPRIRWQAARRLETVERGQVETAVSRDIRTEVEDVLRLKFRWPDERIHAACLPIWRAAINVTPKRTLAVADDPDDDRVIECAVEAKAQAIVSGDNDLLRLGAYNNVAILTPAAFLLTLR
jgi:putative PIN family toxin of toxin-antitoxin system